MELEALAVSVLSMWATLIQRAKYKYQFIFGILYFAVLYNESAGYTDLVDIVNRSTERCRP